jgi:hemerythrin-like metal-binding protein
MAEREDMYIHWEKELELGNDLIDTQHRMLILLCRKLDIAIKTRESEQTIMRVMRELKKFTEFHFFSEENLMREIGYPDLDAHAVNHTDLLMQLESALVKINHHKEFPEDVLFFFNKWLTHHVALEDIKIAKYLKSGLKRPIGEDLYKEFLLSGDTDLMNGLPPRVDSHD